MAHINVHKFKKVIIDAPANSAIRIIFFMIFILLLIGVFSGDINIKKKNKIDINPNKILTPMIVVEFVRWYKFSSPYLLAHSSRNTK